MHRIFFAVCTIAIYLMLSACETTSLDPSMTSPVPPQRIVRLPQTTLDARGAQMTVTRDAGLYGSGLPILLSVNKNEVAYFRTAETLTFSLSPGEHLISVVPSPSMGSSPREYEVHLEPGAKKFYRISVTQGGISFQRTSETH